MIPVLSRGYSRYRAVASAELSPAAGISLHLDPDVLGLSHDDPVSSWTDSANSYVFSQATGSKQPTYKTNVVNGKSALLFDGGDALKRSGPLSDYFSASAATIFMVFAQDGTKATNTPMAVDGLSPWLAVLADYGNVIYFDWGSSGGTGRVNVGSPVGWDDAWHVLALIKDGTDRQSIWVDGVELVGGSTSDTLDMVSTVSLAIGSYSDGGGDSFQGNLGKVVCYPSALSPTDHNQTGYYLADYYGLTTSYTAP